MDDTARGAVVIGYNTRMAAAVGVGGTVMTVLLAGRALIHSSVLDGLLAAGLTLVVVRAVMVLFDSAPLMVADGRGVRVRVAGEWCGLPWVSIAEYSVKPRRFPWSDGQLLFELHHPSHVTESLSVDSRRQVARNLRRSGAPLVVPVGAMTGMSRRDEAALQTRLQVLAHNVPLEHI